LELNVSSDSSLDAFVTSLDSETGKLRVTMNVSGAQGLPADDDVMLTITNSSGGDILSMGVEGNVSKNRLDNGLRQVEIKLRRPPGGRREACGRHRQRPLVSGPAAQPLTLPVVCPVTIKSASHTRQLAALGCDAAHRRKLYAF
jgi:hypothetical protein